MTGTEVLIVGGGVAGMTAAKELAELGHDVIVVERTPQLGGRLATISHVFPTMASGKELASVLEKELSVTGKVRVLRSSTVDTIVRDGDSFKANVLDDSGGRETIPAKAIVLATGLDIIDATIIPEFGLGRHKDVITSVELEAMMSSVEGIRMPSTGAVPRSIVFIQCVGSRVERRGVRYCSNVCCLNAVKNASLLRDLLPGTRTFVLYIDVRTHGKGYEDAYKEARRKGVTFIRGQPSLVIRKEGKLLVCGENTLLKELYEIESDLVVLSVGLRTPERNQILLSSAGIGTDTDGLPLCRDELMAVDGSKVMGIFFAGTVEAPKDVRDSVTHARSCALAVSGFLKK